MLNDVDVFMKKGDAIICYNWVESRLENWDLRILNTAKYFLMHVNMFQSTL